MKSFFVSAQNLGENWVSQVIEYGAIVSQVERGEQMVKDGLGINRNERPRFLFAIENASWIAASCTCRPQLLLCLFNEKYWLKYEDLKSFMSLTTLYLKFLQE